MVRSREPIDLNKEQLKQLRLLLGMSATEFAIRLGVAENTVRRWEVGDRSPTRKRKAYLRKILYQARLYRKLLKYQAAMPNLWRGGLKPKPRAGVAP